MACFGDRFDRFLWHVWCVQLSRADDFECHKTRGRVDRAYARDVWPGHIDRELRRRRAIRSIQVFCCEIHHGVQLFRVVCVPVLSLTLPGVAVGAMMLGCMVALCPALQMRLMDVSKHGQSLVAASNRAALN